MAIRLTLALMGSSPAMPPNSSVMAPEREKSCRRTRPSLHPAIPGQNVYIGLVQRLFDSGEEIQEPEKQDIRKGQPFPTDECLSANQPVEPGHSLLRDRFQVGARGGDAMDT